MGGDEGDELSEFLVTKQPIKKERTDRDVFSFRREPLTTKYAMKLLLEGTLKYKVCRYCLNVESSLYEMDQVFQIGGQSTLYKVAIRDMVASFYPFQVVEDLNYPTKICEKCLEKAMQSYLFTQQCERSGRALHNCFEDMYEKLDKLDPLERTKKRGRQKLNPNHNTLYTEHEKVIDYAEPIINIINRGSELTRKKDDKINDLECPRCWLTFTNFESLINHEKIHPKSMWFHCRLCGKSFVKRRQYRKHIKSTHDSSKDVALPEPRFKCLECDVGNETYDQHLQHIEKHKFQMVMEHLVERKMDKLCTTCLTKDVNMVKLDKTINIHGGCPELTGQRSLYNILGSTMPEQASYKYRELLVPHEAKLLTITKKQNFWGKKTNIPVINDREYYYSLSNPIIISREIFASEDYIFFFTKPNYIEQMIEMNFDEDFHKVIRNKNETNLKNILMEPLSPAPYTSTIENVEVVTNSLTNSSSDQKFIFSFSNPDYDIEIVKVLETSDDTISDSTTTKNGTIDWVFEKCGESNGNVGVKEDLTNKYDESKITTIKECSYCWIFKNTDKCNNCQKQNNTDSSTSDIKIISNIETNGTCVQNNEDQIKKRKKFELKKSGNKRSKWQCKFCLTNNGENEKCYCCDTEYHGNDDHHIKCNLGINKNFLNTNDFSNNILSMNGNNVNLDIIEVAPDKPIAALKINKKNRNETLAVQEVNSNFIPNIEKEDLNLTNPEIVINLKEDEDMDTDFKGINVAIKSSYNDTRDFQEEMDVEECNFSYNMDIASSRDPDYIDNQISTAQFPDSSMKLSDVPFTFNIGSSDMKGKHPRRLKRPIRRMATTFHK